MFNNLFTKMFLASKPINTFYNLINYNYFWTDSTKANLAKWLMEFMFSNYKETHRPSSTHSSYNACDSEHAVKPPTEPPKSIYKLHSWFMDAKFFKKYEGAVMYPDESTKFMKGRFTTRLPIPDRKFQTRLLNFGPAHPSAHGALRLILELDAEIILNSDPHIGLLHRGSEKLCEYKTYLQALPYFDRLDYASAMSNEHAYVLAIEKLMNIQVPRRAKFIRTIFAEIMRLTGHQISLSGQCLDTGAITPFFWLCEEREKLYEFCERASGARMHSCYFRVGGVSLDLPLGFCDDLYDWANKYPTVIDEMEDVMSNNRIFIERAVGVGVLKAHDAMNLAVTGVNLRACGVKWDLRKSQPYDAYGEICFDAAIGTHGDVYDRYLCRMEEMRQSCNIIKQCIEKMPVGEIKTDDYKVSPPKRAKMKSGMEDLIHHFKYFSQGFAVPPGATYTAVEATKGEFGVYIVSDGSTKPYRVRMRAGSFPSLYLMKHLCPGHFLADVCAILGSVDVVFGEVDR